MHPLQSRFAWLLAAISVALAGAAVAGSYKAPRTTSGAPDLQGLWSSTSLTPLARPPEFNSIVVPDDQAAAYERHQNDDEQLEADFRKANPRAPTVGFTDYTEGPPRHDTLSRINGQARGWELIDPPDGKLPLLPATRARLKARRLQENRQFDSAETRPLMERCIIIPGPPMLGGGGHVQIVQTPDHLVIVDDFGVVARIIRLGDRRHGPAQIKPWMGDSIGWWDGDTLVVETTNFNPDTAHWTTDGRTPLSSEAKVTERFSRTSPTEILYRFTVEDPVNYAAPWSGVFPFTAEARRSLSFECHEGNYSLTNILAGARKAERDGGVPEPLDGGDQPPKPVASSAPAPQAAPPPANPPAP